MVKSIFLCFFCRIDINTEQVDRKTLPRTIWIMAEKDPTKDGLNMAEKDPAEDVLKMTEKDPAEENLKSA